MDGAVQRPCVRPHCLPSLRDLTAPSLTIISRDRLGSRSQFIKTHNLVLDPSTDPTLSLAQPGDRIAIDAVARYPGWLNQISSVLPLPFPSCRA